jgi:signal transduction histidine kinase/PAS domain-containing protein
VHDASHDPVGVMLVEAMTQANRFSALKRDLFDLGKRLSSLIRQAERIETKRKAMSAISDPLIILGNDRRVRFANRDAARILGKPEIAERWISRIDAVSLADTTIPLDILQVIQGLVNDQNERNGSCFELRQDQKPRFWNVTATPLLDCFELPGGHLIRMRNRTTVRGAFQVLYQVAASTSVSDAIEVFFDAATKLSLSPPKMARYYRIDECDPNVLVSFRAKGFAEQAKLLAFESGQIRLNRDEDISALDVLPQNIDWPLPRIWQWNQVGDHGSVEWTAKGLPYKITNQGYHAEALEKKPGDFWIDFPLCVRDRDTDAWKALGKITLSFGETDELITPESLDYLSWMAGVLAQFFSSLHDHEGRLSDVIVAEEKALATASHNIRTMVAGLAGYPTRFDGLLDDMTLALKRAHGVDPSLNSTLSEVASRLSSLSSELRKSHGAIDQVLHRMKDRLRGISLGLLERISIRSLVEEASRILPDWVPLEIHGDVEAEVDKTYMLLALQELMLDSVKYRVLDRPLKITVSLEKQHDQRIRIGYSDNGRGVPPAMKERIFEPFVRFSNPTEGQSTGVGLYFVRNVIAAHKGAIKESGVLGEGVCFSIILQESPHVITVNHEIELIGI